MKVKNCIRCNRMLFEVERGRVHKDAAAICLSCYYKLLNLIQHQGAPDVRDLFGGIFRDGKK